MWNGVFTGTCRCAVHDTALTSTMAVERVRQATKVPSRDQDTCRYSVPLPEMDSATRVGFAKLTPRQPSITTHTASIQSEPLGILLTHVLVEVPVDGCAILSNRHNAAVVVSPRKLRHGTTVPEDGAQQQRSRRAKRPVHAHLCNPGRWQSRGEGGGEALPRRRHSVAHRDRNNNDQDGSVLTERQHQKNTVLGAGRTVAQTI